jgi:hypothetical protein
MKTIQSIALLLVSKLKVDVTCREYFCNLDKNVLRLFFWTIESHPSKYTVKYEGDYMLSYRSIVDPTKE